MPALHRVTESKRAPNRGRLLPSQPAHLALWVVRVGAVVAGHCLGLLLRQLGGGRRLLRGCCCDEGWQELPRRESQAKIPLQQWQHAVISCAAPQAAAPIGQEPTLRAFQPEQAALAITNPSSRAWGAAWTAGHCGSKRQGSGQPAAVMKPA